MKCRRRNFTKRGERMAATGYWDRRTQEMRYPGHSNDLGERAARRQGRRNIYRAYKERSSKRHHDNTIDWITQLERESAGQFERVGDKFRRVDGTPWDKRR